MYGADSDKLDLVKKEIVFQYDHSLGYRVMEALRNYVQHRGFPIHSMVFSHQRVGADPDFQWLNRVIPIISVSALEEDGKFKKSILAELNEIQNNNRVDAKPLIRQYIEGIGKIHEKARQIIRPDLVNWEKVLDDTIAKFQSEFGNDVLLAGLAVVAEQDDGQWEEKVTIFKEFIERMKVLEKKNRYFSNLHKRYASNEIRENDA